ncbi:tyrosine-type recombinase/integrase [Pseudanabaena sp. FACHB-1998]|uniref:tyrosine-type recombinase/integrase n=1 Tax=Pseudanabaena sp. FACHB-1998 TaxID=2692858 RepID=UPI001681039B|nr:tyrosine-type recombinase/integrase [Pseudanabaena sp. FACHB-1998]MBD2178649.1 tyrosine-type recombinase/integrase [Pseudanabaena sp. FACHB-1998]
MPIPEPILVIYSEPPKAIVATDLRQTRIDEFLDSRSLQAKSRKAYQSDLKIFMDWCELAWGDVTRRKVTQFKNFLVKERELALSSVNRVLQTLKSFYRWLLISEYVTADPTIGIQLERLPESVSKDLDDDEVLQIYEAIALSKYPERDLAIFTVLLHGLRGEELCNLNVGDYCDGELVIPVAKWDSKGEVPLTKLGLLHLNAYLDWRKDKGDELLPESPLFVSFSNRSYGDRLTYWGVRHVMDVLAKKTGIDLHSHRGRHTFATNLIVKYELDPSLAMELTRHRDIRSFKRYTNRKNKVAAKRAFLKASERLDY